MKALPVVSRELRVASRKSATYWNRCGMAFGAIAVTTIALLILRQGAPRQSGFVVFVWMSIIAYIHCLLMGLALTSDVLAEEKREGTLGLLFLTDLKGYDVVFGKLAASSLRGVYGLLSIFPVLGVCLLLGGVSANEFQRVMLVCLNNLFLSLSIGMLASALCREERASLLVAFIMLVLLTAGFPAFAWIAAARKWHVDAVMSLLVPSPGFSSFFAFDVFYKTKPNWFWPAVALQHALAWVALGFACALVPRSWQDKAKSASGEKREVAIRQWVYGQPAMRRAFRRRLLQVNPYHWLTSRDRFKQTLPWVWLVLAGLVWLIGLWYAPNAWKDEGLYIMTALALHSIFKVSVALEASRRLGLDRSSGALELLLCTPLTPRELVRGQWLSLVRQFAVPAAIIVAADILFLTAGNARGSGEEAWRNTWFCGITVFVADAVTLAWLGMWLGLISRRTGQGGMSAVVQVCALPWLLFMGFIAIMSVLDVWQIVRMRNVGSGFLFTIWWLISMGIDALFGIHAYRRLHADLRSIAADRYVSRGAAWGRALGLAYGRWKAGR